MTAYTKSEQEIGIPSLDNLLERANEMKLSQVDIDLGDQTTMASHQLNDSRYLGASMEVGLPSLQASRENLNSVLDVKESLDNIAARLKQVINGASERQSELGTRPTVSNISLEDLSSNLLELGFAAFPEDVLELSRLDARSSEQQQEIVNALYWTLRAVLSEHRCKAFTVNELVDQVEGLASHMDVMQQRVGASEREPPMKVNNSEMLHQMEEYETLKELYQQLQTEVSKSNDHANAVAQSLRRSEHDNSDLKNQLKDLQAQLEELRQEDVQKKRRAETMVRRVTSGNRRQPVLKEVREVVEYYEDMLQSMQQGLGGPKFKSEDKYLSGSIGNVSNDGADKPRVVIINEEKPAETGVQPPSTSPKSSQTALAEELAYHRAELARVHAALRDAEEEKEILKLKLLSHKSGAEALRDRSLNRQVKTNSLINQDKEYSAQSKLKQLDSISGHEARSIVREICVRLKIRDINRLVDALQDIAVAVNLIPQMQEFIQTVDSITWAPPPKLDEFALPRPQPAIHNAPLRPLHETVARLKQFRQIVDREQRAWSSFKKAAAHLMDIEVEESTDAAIQTLLMRIRDIVDNKAAAENLQTIDYIRALFHVQPNEDVKLKMQQVNQLLNELSAWQKKYAGLLEAHNVLSKSASKRPTSDDVFSIVYDLVEKMASTLEVVMRISGGGSDSISSFQSLEHLLGRIVALAAGADAQ